MTVYDIVRKLIGPIDPAGQSHTDDKRFENLKATCALVEKLVAAIDEVQCRENIESQEFSVARAAKYADNFLTNDLGIIE